MLDGSVLMASSNWIGPWPKSQGPGCSLRNAASVRILVTSITVSLSFRRSPIVRLQRWLRGQRWRVKLHPSLDSRLPNQWTQPAKAHSSSSGAVYPVAVVIFPFSYNFLNFFAVNWRAWKLEIAKCEINCLIYAFPLDFWNLLNIGLIYIYIWSQVTNML